MPVHLAARMHSFVHGLFRPSDETETRELYSRVEGLFVRHDLGGEADRQQLVNKLTLHVLDHLEIAPDHAQAEVIHHLISRLLDYEGLFVLPRIDWSVRHSVTEYWDVRDELNRQRVVLEDFEDTQDLICRAIILFLEPIYEVCPALLAADNGEGDITVPTELIHSLRDVGGITEQFYGIAFAEQLEKAGLFTRLSDGLERNLVAASGGDPRDPKGFAKAPKMPIKSDIKNPEDLLDTYLGGTPLRNLFE